MNLLMLLLLCRQGNCTEYRSQLLQLGQFCPAEERKTTSHTLCALLADEGGHSAFQHGDGLCRLGHTRGQARPGNGEKVFVSTTPGSVFLF